MILLDTCTLIWFIGDQSLLSSKAKSSLQENARNLFVSGISAFEIARLVKKRKITLPASPLRWFYAALQEQQIQEISLSTYFMFLAEDLPDIHQDPADRFLIATALAYDLTIVTPDQTIAKYPHVKTMW